VCRFYIAKGPVDLSRALRLAAKYDPYAPGERKQHGDGWGYVAVLGRGYMYYRSEAPIWEDPTPIPMGEVVLAHARAASPGEPLGVQHAHPYMAYTPDGRLIFLAHNGSVDKKAIAQQLGLDPAPYTDSHILALYLAKHWDNPQAAVEKALPYVKTALNIAVVELPGPKAYAYTYYRGEGEYYPLYLLRLGVGKAVVSSTLLRHVDADATGLEKGTFLQL